MERHEEGKRIKRSVYIPDATWDRVRAAAGMASSRRSEYVSTSQWIEEAINEKADREAS